MKLLMTTDTVGGVWTYALDLAAALEPHGVEVTLATMGAAMSAQQRRDVAKRPNVDVRESTFKLEWMHEPEQKLAPDVVHLNGYAHGSLPFRAPVAVVAHSCVLSWWRAVKGET